MAKPLKLTSRSYLDFSETIKHIVLMCSNVIGNNNKFYSLEIQKNKNNEYLLFSHYGRINGDSVTGGAYEVRTGFKTSYDAEREFDSIVKTKQRGKTKSKDGLTYKETYTIVDIVSSSVGSSNVIGKSIEIKSKKKLDKNLFESFGKSISLMLKKLEEENIHEITNSTTMTYNSNGLQTPLGPLTFEHINNARNVLDKINNNVVQDEKLITIELKKLNNQYLSLIPRNLGNKINDSKLVYNIESVTFEYDLLNQMETAIKLASLNSDDNNAAKDSTNELGFNIELASEKEHKDIIDYVNKTRKHSDLNKFKVKNVYKFENYKERKRFENFADNLNLEFENKNKKREHNLDYKELDLFHGSKNSNILSILMNGFYVPPESAAHVTARMFGNGVYAADSSTKSLRYSLGRWSNTSNKYKNCFCFLVRMATGKVFETGNELKSGVPKGYNSIFAKGGHDLINNEYIAKNTEQLTISYLIEFE